ncbi:lipopolysaccharide biosynthesis protein [Vibrio sp. RC27]
MSKLISKLSNSRDTHIRTRNFRLLISIGTSVLAKFISIGSTLITTPLTLGYLGAEGFAVWMVISGFVAFLGFSDLGIGMGLQNALSKCCGREDKDSPKYYISNAYLLISGLAFCVAVLSYLVFSFLQVEMLFKIEDQKFLQIAVITLQYSIYAFLINMPIALVLRVLGGIQKTYIANNVNVVGSIASLLSIFLSVHFDLGLTGLTVLFIVSPSLIRLLYGIYFYSKNEDLRPRFVKPSKVYLSPLMSAGAWTVMVQLIYSVKMNIPTMIISSTLGMVAVAEYTVAQKLIGLAASMIGMALQPLWVVYGEAFHRGDKLWVQSTLKKSIKLVVLLSVIAAVAFQFVGEFLITFWLGGQLIPSQMLILGFSLWMIASNINICYAMLLNGTGHFKNQAVFSFICVGAMVIINKAYVLELGTVGVIFTTFIIAELIRIPFFHIQSIKMIRKIS